MEYQVVQNVKVKTGPTKASGFFNNEKVSVKNKVEKIDKLRED